ncbi:Protein MAM-7, partial [Aphelenchoides avenae]
VFLRAENFVFHTANLQGGFAIIDSIEYYGDFCTKDGAFSHTANSVQENVSGIRSPFLSNDQDPPTSDGRLASAANGTTHSGVPVMAGIRTSVDLASTRARGACLALNCSFDENDCTDYTHGSEWTVSKHPVGNPLTGIRGDASRLPYNSNGSFVYAVGPKAVARFVTRPFSIDKDIYFMFAYHKVSRQATLRVMLKKENEPEKALFEVSLS